MELELDIKERIWSAYEKALLKEQEDPYIETISFDSDDQALLTKALRGDWDAIVVEAEDNNFDYLYDENKATRQRVFDDTLREFKTEINNFIESSSEDVDIDELKEVLFEDFETRIEDEGFELRDGYIQFKFEWNGSQNVRFDVFWRGSGTSKGWFDDTNKEIRPDKEMIGLLELLNIPVEEFAKEMRENILKNEEFESKDVFGDSPIEVFDACLEKALKDFNASYGPIHYKEDTTPSVSAKDFSLWVYQSFQDFEELGNSGFAATISLDGDELTEICENIAYIKGNVSNKATEEFLYAVKAGAGLELYCAEGNVREPLRTTGPLEFYADMDLYVDRDYDGMDVGVNFFNIDKYRAASNVKYTLSANLPQAAEDKYGVNSDFFRKACKKLDLNPWLSHSLNEEQLQSLKDAGVKERPFTLADASYPINPDFLSYLSLPESKEFEKEVGVPLATLLLYANSFSKPIELFDFVRENRLQFDAQDINGNSTLHALLYKMGERYGTSSLESSAEWVNKNTLFMKNNEGKTPFDLYLNILVDKTSCPEALIQSFDNAGVEWNKPMGYKRWGTEKTLAQLLDIEEHSVVQRQKLKERVGLQPGDVAAMRSAL